MSNKNLQINGFRAVLIFSVILYHYIFMFGQKYIGGNSFSINFIPGQAAVCVFFFLSGWFASIKTAKDFWLKKFFKIILPLLLAMTLILLVKLLLTSFDISPLSISMNYLIIPMITNLFEYIDGSHWYIMTLIYYFVIYTISYLISRLFNKNNIIYYIMIVLFFVCFVVTIFIKPSNNVFRAIRCLFPSHFLLILSGFFLRKFFIIREQKKCPVWVLVVFIILTSLFQSFVCYLNYGLIQMAFLAGFFLPLVFLSIFGQLFFFENKVFQIIGDSSLWIYLLHQEIGYLIIHSFFEINLYWLGVIISLLVLVLFSIAINIFWQKIIVTKIITNTSKNKRTQ